MLCTIRRVSGAGRRDVSGRKTGEGSGKMQKSICPEWRRKWENAKINLPGMGMLLRPRPGVLRRSQRKHRPPRRMQTPCRPPASLRMLAVRHKACPLLGLPLWKRSRRPRPLTTPGWTIRRWPNIDHPDGCKHLAGPRLPCGCWQCDTKPVRCWACLFGSGAGGHAL